MRIVRSIIIVIALLFFGVTTICSGVEPDKEAPKVTPTPTPTPLEKKKVSTRHLKQISGTVTAIDRAEKSITVGGIKMIADEKMLANINEGDRVKVDYYSRGVHKAIVISREVK